MAENKRGKISQLPYLEDIEGGESLLGASDGKGFQVTIDTLKEYVGSGGSGSGASVDLTKVKSSILPYSDNDYSLGSADKKWSAIHADSLFLGTNTRMTTDSEEDRIILEAHLRVKGASGNLSEVMTQSDMGEYAKVGQIPTDYASKSELTQAITNVKGGASTGYDTLKKLEDKVRANAQSIANKPSETYTFGDGLKVERGKVSVKIDPLPELQFGSGLYPIDFGENGGITLKIGDGIGVDNQGKLTVDLSGYQTKSDAAAMSSSLQGQIDGLWSRNSFDELLLGHAAADTIAVGELNVDKVNGYEPIHGGNISGYLNGYALYGTSLASYGITDAYTESEVDALVNAVDKKAGDAATAASNAQSTANTAKTNASNAQSTADSALSKANANEASIAALGVKDTTLTNKINEVDGVAKQNKTDIATLNTTTKNLQSSINDLNVFKGSALSDLETLMTFYEGTDTDTTINKWQELEKVLKGLTESDNLADILNGKADKSTVYTKTEVDTNFVSNDRANNFAEYGQFLNINNGTITINGTSIKPLISHQTLYSLILKDSAGTTMFTYDPKTEISGGYVYQLTKSTVGLGNVENTKLSTWKGTTNITTLGTITSGTWNGTKIGQSYLDLSGYATQSWVEGKGYLTSYTEKYTGTVTGVKINGTTKNPSSGIVDLGTVITAHQSLANYVQKGSMPYFAGVNVTSGADLKLMSATNLSDPGDIIFLDKNENEIARIWTDADSLGAIGLRTRFGSSDPTKVILHSGNINSYALPLSGGAIAGGAGALRIVRGGGDYASTIKFENSIKELGHLGISNNGDAILLDANGTNQKVIIHTGNIGSQSVDASRRFEIVVDHNSANKDLNTNLFGGGLMHNYAIYSSNIFENVPSGMLYGCVLELSAYGTDNAKDDLSGQLAWDVNHRGTDSTRNLWWRANDDTNFSNAKWHQIAFTDSTVAAANKLSTARTIWGRSFDGSGNVSGNIILGQGRIIFDSTLNHYIGLSGSALIYNNAGGHEFYAGGASKFIINRSGNVGIGTISPTKKLHVNGDSLFNGHLTIDRGTAQNYITFEKTGSVQGYLGFDGVDNPIYIPSAANVIYPLIHSGNYEEYTVHKNAFEGALTRLTQVENIADKNKSSIEDLWPEFDSVRQYTIPSLQGQIDGLWARNSFDELYATHVMSDTLAVEEMFADKLSIGEAVLQYDSYNKGLALSTSLYIEGSEVALASQLATAAQKSNWNTAYSNWTNGVSSFKTDKIVCKSDNDYSIAIGSIQLSSGMTGYSMYPMVSSNLYMSLGAEDYSFYQVYAYTYNNTSDATKKNILGDVNLSVNSIANAPAKVFTWKDNPDTRRKVGTIAQYWRDVLPEVVSGKEGSMSMNYAELAVVISIILARSVETHEQRIERLERENEELRKEILTLKNR